MKLGCWIVTLLMLVAQVSAEEEEEMEVFIGSNVTIDCVVPQGARSITWLLNGAIIARNRQFHYSQYDIVGSDREYNLRIRNVSLSDQGKLSCQVRTNDSKSVVIVTSVIITVIVPPKTVRILQGPTAQSMAGNQTLLTCEAYLSKPPVTLMWMASGDVLIECPPDTSTDVTNANSENQFGNTTCQIVLKPTRADQSREYECRAIGKSLATPVTVRTQLDVHYAPEIELYVQPSNVALQEDMPVSITCAAESNPPPELWEWRINNEKELHVSGRTFVIDRLNRRHHNATVLCTVYNMVDAARKSLILNVEYPPKFVHSNYIHKANVGDTVTLSCAVDANPPATIKWQRKDIELGTTSELPEFGDSSLVTVRVDSKAFGEYVCVAQSPKFEQSYETSIFILEKSAPVIRSVHPVQATVRSAAHIPCTIDAVPRPSVTWSRNNLPITKDAKYSISEEEFLGGLTSILSISTVEKSDFGEYNCSAVNELGTVTRRVILTKITETNIDLAIGGSIGAIMALLCILILSGIMLRQRRKRQSIMKRGQSRLRPDVIGGGTPSQNGAKFVGPPQIPTTICYEPTTEFSEPLLQPAQADFSGHKCVAFGGRTMYCASGNAYKMEPIPTDSPSHRSFDQPWLSNAPVSYLQPDAVDNDRRKDSDVSVHAHANLLISMSPSHCPHHVPITSITAVPHRPEDEINVVGEEARDDSSRSFDSGYGAGSANANQHGTPQINLSGNMHGSAIHVPHCTSLPGRLINSQHATPCRDSKLLIIPQDNNHPFTVPHCYNPRASDSMNGSNFLNANLSESPGTIWELDAHARVPQLSASSNNNNRSSIHGSSSSNYCNSNCNTLNRTSIPRHGVNSISVPIAMPSLNISPNLHECDEAEDIIQESFNELRSDSDCKKETCQPRQYASVV